MGHSCNYDTTWLSISDTSVHNTCHRVDKQPSVSYAASIDAYTVDESFTQIDLPPGIENKISTVSCDSATWHTD